MPCLLSTLAEKGTCITLDISTRATTCANIGTIGKVHIMGYDGPEALVLQGGSAVARSPCEYDAIK